MDHREKRVRSSHAAKTRVHEKAAPKPGVPRSMSEMPRHHVWKSVYRVSVWPP